MSPAVHTGVTLRVPPWRARLLLVLLLAWFVALAARALYLQGLHDDFLHQKGESRYARVIELSATRGMIVDRNKEPLAISTPVESVAASPADIQLDAEQAAALARLLKTSTEDLQRKLADTRREFVYLRRQLPPASFDRYRPPSAPGASIIA